MDLDCFTASTGERLQLVTTENTSSLIKHLEHYGSCVLRSLHTWFLHAHLGLQFAYAH